MLGVRAGAVTPHVQAPGARSGGSFCLPSSESESKFLVKRRTKKMGNRTSLGAKHGRERKGIMHRIHTKRFRSTDCDGTWPSRQTSTVLPPEMRAHHKGKGPQRNRDLFFQVETQGVVLSLDKDWERMSLS